MVRLIELESVRKEYPMTGQVVKALKSVSLSFDEGEFVSIVGSSGSGKSTLLYLLGLLTQPSGGAHRFGGRDMQSLSDRECSRIRGSEIGFVFQSFHLVPQLTVLKNVLMAARYCPNLAGGDLKKKATNLLNRVGLSHRLHHKPFQLSNGEMQRVAIARALLGNPRLILADEPTGNLDEANGEEIMKILKSLRDEGKTVIMVTHNLQLAAQTDRIITIRDGEVAS